MDKFAENVKVIEAAIDERDALRAEIQRVRQDWKRTCEVAIQASEEIARLKARIAELEAMGR